MLFAKVNDFVTVPCTHGTTARIEVDNAMGGHAIAPAYENQLIALRSGGHQWTTPG